MFVSYHNDGKGLSWQLNYIPLIIVGHHGNLQDTESPMSCYPPSLRHVSDNVTIKIT